MCSGGPAAQPFQPSFHGMCTMDVRETPQPLRTIAGKSWRCLSTQRWNHSAICARMRLSKTELLNRATPKCDKRHGTTEGHSVTCTHLLRYDRQVKTLLNFGKRKRKSWRSCRTTRVWDSHDDYCTALGPASEIENSTWMEF